MKIIADAEIPFIEKYFGPEINLQLVNGRKLSTIQVKDADILIVRSVTEVNQTLLVGSKVKFVGSVTAGTDHLDTKWLDDANILWSSAQGFNAPPVADYVVATLAALWHEPWFLKKNLKAAVIGVGHVGSLVVQKLKQLGCEVIVCDPVRSQQEKDFISTPIDEISDVDFISLHVPLEHNGLYPTYHLIDKKFLKRQKSNCVLLNASRGAVIDSEALQEYGGHLKWCLDVWEYEPNIDKEILKQTLIATPHIAGYSVQSKVRGMDMIYRCMCQLGLMKSDAMTLQEMPTQTLQFSDQELDWTKVVLGVFNPILMSQMMKVTLDKTDDVGLQFDHLRKTFNYRYEFAFTDVVKANIPSLDKKILLGLGFNSIL